MSKPEQSLIDERNAICDALANCDGGFPGSAEHKRESSIIAELGRFDQAHPEVLAWIRSEQAAQAPKGWV